LFLELLRSNADQRAASSYIDRLKLVAKKGEISSEYADRMSKFAYANLRQQGHVSDAEAKLYQTALTRPGAIAGGIRWYQANIPTFEEIADKDFWPSPKASTTVTSLLIWGQDDGTFVPAFLEQLPIYAKDLTIEVLPDVGHWPALEAPTEVNKLLRNFIQSP
jgi:pimeloyl-ACP methyl ester carboxylesterase